MAKKKYYAVAVGRERGIYGQWYGDRGAEKQVKGFPGALFKGFGTRGEAEAFLRDHEAQKGKPTPRINMAASGPASKAKKGDSSPTPDDAVIIYTDGSSLGNPGPGGYGVVIVEGDAAKELSMGYRLTTNNRMELLACIVALEQIEEQSAILLYSDSQYVVNGITKGWARRWRANGWMRTKSEPASNPDLWERLLVLCDEHDVKWRWVRGHAGIEGNERCDQLATRAASGPDLRVDRIYEATNI